MVHLAYRIRCFAVFAVLLSAFTAQQASAQVRKACAPRVTLRLSAAGTVQGGLLLAEVSGAKDMTNPQAEWNGQPVPLWREPTHGASMHGLLGVDLETKPGKYEWKLTWQDGRGATASCSATVLVRAGKFLTERLKVENQFVQPDPEQQKRAEADQKKMKAIYDTITPERLWDGKFRVPLDNVTTGGNFGRRRVLNGQARSPHAGVDFPAAAGTAVFAAQSGRVVVAENLYYSGNTVVIDHGYGIYTLYAHLSEIGVHAGDAVKVSEQIGKVGATGRVTGPHLHWGMTIDHARVNALNIVQREP
jgi:Peptidase family M23